MPLFPNCRNNDNEDNAKALMPDCLPEDMGRHPEDIWQFTRLIPKQRVNLKINKETCPIDAISDGTVLQKSLPPLVFRTYDCLDSLFAVSMSRIT